MYFAYVACKNTNGAVALFDETGTEVWHRSFCVKIEKESKYNIWFTGFNTLLSCLRDSLLRKEISEDVHLRINVPVYVFYKWLTGSPVPEKYAQRVEDLLTRLQRLSCTVELTPVFGGERTNRAAVYCCDEDYTNIRNIFDEDMEE